MRKVSLCKQKKYIWNGIIHIKYTGEEIGNNGLKSENERCEDSLVIVTDQIICHVINTYVTKCIYN